jgi:hypothetical protein
MVINEVPKLSPEDIKNTNQENKEEAGFRPYIQIFRGAEPIYNYLTK